MARLIKCDRCSDTFIAPEYRASVFTPLTQEGVPSGPAIVRDLCLSCHETVAAQCTNRFTETIPLPATNE